MSEGLVVYSTSCLQIIIITMVDPTLLEAVKQKRKPQCVFAIIIPSTLYCFTFWIAWIFLLPRTFLFRLTQNKTIVTSSWRVNILGFSSRASQLISGNFPNNYFAKFSFVLRRGRGRSRESRLTLGASSCFGNHSFKVSLNWVVDSNLSRPAPHGPALLVTRTAL